MPRRAGLSTASVPEKSGTILQFKVWLLGLSPMVWCRLHLPAAFTLRRLHGVIQVAMGWEGIHLFQFHLRAIRYGSWEVSARSPEVTLESLRLRRGALFAYANLVMSNFRLGPPGQVLAILMGEAKVGFRPQLWPLDVANCR